MITALLPRCPSNRGKPTQQQLKLTQRAAMEVNASLPT
jgi:hypothetical protein